MARTTQPRRSGGLQPGVRSGPDWLRACTSWPPTRTLWATGQIDRGTLGPPSNAGGTAGWGWPTGRGEPFAGKSDARFCTGGWRRTHV